MGNQFEYLTLASSLHLKGDEVIFLSADLTRLAMLCAKNKVQFKADEFIQSFMHQLPSGTLVIPTYTDNLTDGMTFDVLKSKPNIGAIAVRAFQHSSFFRTSDPFHSMAVWGKHLQPFKEITDNHTFGKNSAFGVLHQLNAKMVMIDLTLNQNFTFLHYCEESANVFWRKLVKHKMNIVNEEGAMIEKEFWFYTRKLGYQNALDPLEKILTHEGYITSFDWKGVSIKTLDFSPVFDRILMDIKNNKGRSFRRFSVYEFFKAILKKIKLYLYDNISLSTRIFF